MVYRRSSDRSRRFPVALAVGAAAALLLSGCGAAGEEPESGPDPAGFDDLQSATVYIKGQGTFIDPGSLDPAEGRWIGSGFVVSDEGRVITNNHVVTGAGTLDVLLGGEDEVGAEVLGASECLDLAVLQLDEGEYPFLAWHDGEIKTGLDVYSAGYPLGAAEEFTLTRGIVSKDDFPLDTQWASLEHVIEHDARIRGGNSGGPLVDENGAVVGVNYAGDDSLDYNFAIHRDVAEENIDAIASGERVLSIGINAQGWSNEDDSLFGIWVQSVEAGGPADAAGIEPGDLIFSLAGVTVGDDGTLGTYCEVLDTQGSDATIDIEVYRPGTDELLEGQINGDELAVKQSGYLGGSVPDDGGFQSVTDDAGVLSVSVPADWAEVDGAGFTDGSGTSWYALSAAPVLESFWGTFTGSGVQFMGSTEAGQSAADLLTSLSGTYDSECSPVETAESYDDGYYTGVYSEWDCSGTSGIVLSAIDAGGNNVVLLLQLNSDYEKTDALTEIISTFYADF
ncbi:S1C family serine protease [Microbacterium sp. SS28]|uniref:S1C family serine protease n=1 Tax=Microbacterium sp. SS28 TaxID=2919948 RepID=UPI001FAAB1DA|nr:S1C family serine protease [Microbacterium sp. SS28]